MRLAALILASVAGLLMAGGGHAQIAVKIGVLNDRSGIYADLSGEGSVVAAHMAVEDFDAADKGINVEIVSADHQNKPDVASNIARQWYDQDGVDVIADVPTSSAALAVNDITKRKEQDLPQLRRRPRPTSPARNARRTRSTGPTTPGRSPTAPAAPWSAQGGDTWFFITADYAFGHALERDTSAVVKAAGGEVLGTVRHPFPGQDFSSFLLQAQASGAQVIGLANAGGDTINSIKQASEFGITQGGQTLAGLLIFITDVHALGLETAQGLVLTESFYWDLNDETRAWSERFAEAARRQEADHGAGRRLCRRAALPEGGRGGRRQGCRRRHGQDEGDADRRSAVRQGRGPRRRPQGPRHVPLPGEEAGRSRRAPWDYYELVATIPADQAFRPLADGGCPLVK